MLTESANSSVRVFVVGAGGHGKVVFDAMQVAGMTAPGYSICFLDDDQACHGHTILGANVLGGLAYAMASGDLFHVAIGSNRIRENISLSLGCDSLISVIHPRAVIAMSSVIGKGVFAAANSVVAPDARLGDGVIVNHGAIIDHDCCLGNFCHISPGASLAGGVHLGSRVLVGAGARILPGVQVGDDCIVAAGAVVCTDVADGLTVMGVPARAK